MKKTKILKILRLVLFLIGFPLLLLLTAIKTMPYFGEPMFKDSCAYGIFVVLIMWAVVEIVRLILVLSAKNKHMLQAIIVTAVALIVMVVPCILFDYLMGPKVDAAVSSGANYQIAYIVEGGSAKLVSADTEGATVIPVEFADVRHEVKSGAKLQTFRFQLGKYSAVTEPSRIDKALYRLLLDKGDSFMYFYQINKWYNYEDYYFSNYTGIGSNGQPSTDGYLPGVATKINSEIKTLESAVVAYHRAYVANGNSHIGLEASGEFAAFQEAMGIVDSTKHWSLNELYVFRVELSIKPLIYPLFVARNLVYIFIGIVAISNIAIGYINDKLNQIKLGKED